MPNLRSKRNPRRKMTTKTTAYTFPRRASTAPRNLRRKARKPLAKRKMAAARRPFVEIKARDHKALWVTMGGTELSPVVDNVTDPTVNQNMTTNVGGTYVPHKSHFFPLWSFLNPVQGVTDADMIGTQMVPKYLTCKLTWTWPSVLQANNPKYYLIHGWCTTPMNTTEFTTPKTADLTRAQIITHVTNHVRRDFDESVKKEHLQFKPIETKDYTILGYKRIRPNNNSNQIAPANVVAAPITSMGAPAVIQQEGRLGQINMAFKWPLSNKKVQFSYGATSAPSGTPFLFNNKGWIPFLLYYCPSAGEGIGPLNGQDNSPSIAYNDKTWFSDS